MKKTLLVVGILAVVAVAAWFVLGNRSSNALHRYVPSGSALVLTIDLPSLVQKMEPAQLKEREFWKKMKRESGSDSANILLIESALIDPEITGIAYKQNPVFFVEPGSGAHGSPRTGFVLGISDKSKFTEFVKKLSDDEPIYESGGCSIMGERGERNIWMWNNDVALLYQHDNAAGAFDRADSILKKEIDPVTGVDLFKKRPGKAQDLSVFINMGQVMAMGVDEMSPVLKTLGFPTDYAAFMGISFNAGKIDIEMASMFGSNEDEEKANITRQEGGVNYLSHVSRTAPVAVMQTRLDYEKIFDRLMEIEESRNSLDEMAKQIGVERKQLRDLLTGDLCLAFNGVSEEVVYPTFMGMGDMQPPDTVNMPDLGLFVGVKDKDLMKKVLAASGQQPAANGVYTISMFFIPTFYLVQTPEGLVVTLTRSSADILGEKGKLSDGNFGEISDFVKKEATSLYANLDTKTMPPSLVGFMKREMDEDYDMMETVMKPFSAFRFWSSSKNKAYGEVAFKDANGNSMSQLLNMLDAVAKKEEEWKARRKQERELIRQQMQEQEEMIDEEIMLQEYELQE